jgi:hypothetical protein
MREFYNIGKTAVIPVPLSRQSALATASFEHFPER